MTSLSCSGPSRGPGYFWRAKSNQKRFPGARGAEAAPSLRFSLAAGPRSRDILSLRAVAALPGLQPFGPTLLAAMLGSRYGIERMLDGFTARRFDVFLYRFIDALCWFSQYRV